MSPELEKAVAASPVTQRRLRSYWLDYKEVIQLTQSWSWTPEFVSVPKMELPEDAFVVQTFLDPLTACFVFVIASKEFEPVEEGVEPPRVRATHVTIQLKRDTELSAAAFEPTKE